MRGVSLDVFWSLFFVRPSLRLLYVLPPLLLCSICIVFVRYLSSTACMIDATNEERNTEQRGDLVDSAAEYQRIASHRVLSSAIAHYQCTWYEHVYTFVPHGWYTTIGVSIVRASVCDEWKVQRQTIPQRESSAPRCDTTHIL